jgi:hypothetical protein
MNFLFPMFLAAGAAVLVPLLLHLRRQPPSKVVEFSSLDFLQASPMPTTTRRRLERWLLLLLRCLAIALLALMFARPYRTGQITTTEVGEGLAQVVLVDRSASMSREGLWEEAKSRALDYAAAAKTNDRVALGTFDLALNKLVSFSDTQAMAGGSRAAIIQSALDKQQPGQLGTALDEALMQAAAWLDETRTSDDSSQRLPASREIVLITDLQEGAELERLRGFTWPQDVTLRIETIASDEPGGVALALVTDEVAAAGSDKLRVRLTNSADSDATNYDLLLDDKKLSSGQAAAGSTRILKADKPLDEARHVIQIKADDWDLDNRIHLAPQQTEKPIVLAVSTGGSISEASSPWYYLERALQPTSRLAPSLQVVTDNDTKAWNSATLAVMAMDGPLGPQLDAARKFVEAGGTLLVLLTDKTKDLDTLTGAPLNVTEASVKNYALLSELDTKHPLLMPFSDARLANFSQLHVWHHRVINGLPESAQVLARFDDKTPALTELKLGKGRLHLMSTTWAPSDSQLALVPQFIPLIFSWLELAGSSMLANQQLLTGQKIPGTDRVAEQLGWITENGKTYAVNLPPTESRLKPLSESVFAALNLPVVSDSTFQTDAVERRETSAVMEIAAQEQRQGLWVLLLGALLWMVGLETWLASRRSTELIAKG